MKRSNQYPFVHLSLSLFLVVLLLFFIGRLALFIVNREALSSTPLILSYGLRYDLRWSSLITIPFILLRLASSRIFPRGKRFITNVYVHFIIGSLILLLTFDYFYFQYTQARINANLMELMTPVHVALKMVWQSYPVIWILLLLSLIYLIFFRAFLFFKRKMEHSERIVRLFPWIVLLMLFSIWGSFRRYPLTWSDAWSKGPYGLLCINPAESFFYGLYYYEKEINLPADSTAPVDSLFFRKDSIHKIRMSALKDKLLQNIGTDFNVVVLLAESLSTFKTSMAGNPLDATPGLNQLLDKSIYFPFCYTPHYGTSRAIWSMYTGIPDVSWRHLSTHRIPTKEMYSIVNEIPFAQRFYMMGGAGNWANIKGFYSNTIKNGIFLDQESFDIETSSVWGIDDYDLLMQADSIFRIQEKPFFAFVQTSGNHRPYSIPESAALRGFERRSVASNSAIENGFESLEEYYSLSYLDFCIKKYFEKAAASAYFKKTLFIILGDHGNRGDASKFFGKRWNDFRIYMIHVPLFFYAPGGDVTGVDSSYCSILDVFPSVAALKNIAPNPRLNGISLFSDTVRRGLFYMLHEVRKIGWHSPESTYLRPLNREAMHSNKDSKGSDTVLYNRLTIDAYEYYRRQIKEGIWRN